MKSLFPFLNKKGNAMLLAIVAIAVMGPAFYSFSVYLLNQKKQITKNTKLLQQKFALHSAMDYVIFGIKQKYCFDSLLLNDLPSNCNLNHPGSVERLIMSSDQENSIRNNIAGGINVGPYTLNSLHMDSYTNTVQISSLTTLHPLYKVMNAALINPISGIYVKIERDNSRNIPRSGKEIFLKVTVEFVDTNGNHPVTFGNLSMTQTSYLSIYPREISSFALLISGDLYLDRAYNSNVPTGSSVIHNYSNGFQQNVVGLLFDSPVFVNNNIHLPYVSIQNGGHQNNSVSYTPVTFADRVYIGNGYLYENGQVYEPNSAGGYNDRLWSQNKLVGGFLRGIEIDGGVDQGLSVFGFITPPVTPNSQLMAQCIQYYNQLADSSYIQNNSELRSYLISSNNAGAYQKFKITLNRNDRFSPQANNLAQIVVPTEVPPSVQFPQPPNWSGTITRTVPQGVTNGAIVNLNVTIGSWILAAQLPEGGILDVTPQVGSSNFQSGLSSTLASANTNLTQAQNAMAALQANLANANAALATLNQQLQTKQAMLQSDQGQLASNNTTISQNGTQIGILQAQAQNQTGNQLQNTLNQISALQQQNTNLQNVNQTLQSNINNLATVIIPNLQNQIAAQNQVIAGIQNQINQQQQVVNQATQAVNVAQANLNTYLFKVQNPPHIQIKISGYNFNNNSQPNKKTLEISVTNVGHMLDYGGNLVAPLVEILAYNPTFSNSLPLAPPPPQVADNLTGVYKFFLNNNNTGYHQINSISHTTQGNLIQTADSIFDVESFLQNCHAQANVMSSQAFGGASWNLDFSSQTRNSWNFAGPAPQLPATVTSAPLTGTMIFDVGNSSIQQQNVKFQVKSIVGTCDIKSSAELVTGFFACDNLIIRARNTPLRIIGSFIVGNLLIHPSAIKSGIRWSSIYHPQSVYELRNAGVLTTIGGGACTNNVTSPIWHPVPSFQDVSDRYACSVHSLRAKADPFQWTAVDPDCGLATAASTNNTCKNRMIRFYAVELSREGGI